MPTPTDLVTTLVGGQPESPALVATLLDAAERRLRVRITDLDHRMDTEDGFAETVDFVKASAVARVLKNPDGYRSEAAGGVSYTLDTRAAAGFLVILDDEWSSLGVTEMFSIAPYIEPRPYPDPWWPGDGWRSWC